MTFYKKLDPFNSIKVVVNRIIVNSFKLDFVNVNMLMLMGFLSQRSFYILTSKIAMLCWYSTVGRSWSAVTVYQGWARRVVPFVSRPWRQVLPAGGVTVNQLYGRNYNNLYYLAGLRGVRERGGRSLYFRCRVCFFPVWHWLWRTLKGCSVERLGCAGDVVRASFIWYNVLLGSSLCIYIVCAR